jgi:hypothetical protein
VICQNWNLHYKKHISLCRKRVDERSEVEFGTLKYSVTRKWILIKLAEKSFKILCKEANQMSCYLNDNDNEQLEWKNAWNRTTMTFYLCMQDSQNTIVPWEKGLIRFLLILPSILIWHSTSKKINIFFANNNHSLSLCQE